MFAPNRLITVKEQWLLLGIVVALVAGSVSMYLYGKGGDASGEETVLAPKNPDASIPLRTTEPRAAVVSPVLGELRGNVAAPVRDTPKPAPEIPPVSQVQGAEAIPLPVKPHSFDRIASGESGSAPQTIGVAVMGAVNHPGLYMTPPTYRVADLIGLAGGATPAADLSEIMLTATLIDETTLTVPERAVQHVAGNGVSIRRPSNVVLNPAQYVKRVSRLDRKRRARLCRRRALPAPRIRFPRRRRYPPGRRLLTSTRRPRSSCSNYRVSVRYLPRPSLQNARESHSLHWTISSGSVALVKNGFPRYAHW